MAARLKVFRTQSGFFDTVVAAPSRKAALAAWGAHADLFAQGFASVSEDESANAAALARPGVTLRRAVGTDAPWTGPDEIAALPDVPVSPRPPRKTVAKPRASPKPAPPKPDRSRLDAAERALADHDATEREAEARRRAEKQALDVRHATERDRAEARRRALTAALEREAASFAGPSDG